MKHLMRSTLVLGLFVLMSGSGFAQDEQEKTAEQEILAQTEKFIADGSPVVLEEFGFSMTPPVDWEVYKNHPNLTWPHLNIT